MAAVSIPIIPLPLFIRKGPRARRGIYFMAFCFVQGTVGHFSTARACARVRSTLLRTAHRSRSSENKNEKLSSTLCGENDFLPARLAFFRAARPPLPSALPSPPVQSIPAIIASPPSFLCAPAAMARRGKTTSSRSRPKTPRRCRQSFFSISFISSFFSPRPLKINSTPYV